MRREHTGQGKHPLLITQVKTLCVDITEGKYRNQTDYILCSQRWRSSIESEKKKKNDHELTVAQIMNSLLPRKGKESRSVMSNSLQLHGLQPTGSSVHGNSQARILEWVGVFFSRESS